MATAAAKPVKLTARLIEDYFAELARVNEAKAALKPLQDKANDLLGHIEKGFLALGVQKKKLGKFLMTLATKPGSVQWKAELVKRLTSEELEAIQSAAPEKVQVEITPV